MSHTVEMGSSIAAQPRFNKLALSSLISTILLIMVGSLVRVTGYGLGCPDWPLCYGRAVPPIEAAAWVEFGHRLFGAIVSFQILGLAWLAYRDYRNVKWIWRPAIFAVIMLAVQILLGGIHVLNELPSWTGLVHTGVATGIAGLLAVLFTISSPTLSGAARRMGTLFDMDRLKIWSLVGAASSYILILSGSLVTRTGASLACPSFPLCGISDIPDSIRNLTTIQMVHRIVALTVILIATYLIRLLLKDGRSESVLRFLSRSLMALFTIQVGLGIANVLLYLPLWSRILHLGTATTIWVVFVIVAVLFTQPKLAIPGGETA